MADQSAGSKESWMVVERAETSGTHLVCMSDGMWGHWMVCCSVLMTAASLDVRSVSTQVESKVAKKVGRLADVTAERMVD